MEPSYKGVPRRIYRGRILKSLHSGALTPTEIGHRVVDGFRNSDISWIRKTLVMMEEDGLIVVSRRRRIETVTIAR